jgi:tetratricopeptide (TPR) repeat protein
MYSSQERAPSGAYEHYRSLMRARRYGEAARFAEEQYERGPGQSAFWLNHLAGALTRAGEPERGLETARRALEIDPANPFGLLAAANALFALERFEEALDYYREAADEEKTSRRARRAVVDCLVRLERWDEVLSRVAQWGLTGVDQARVSALKGLGRLGDALELCERWLTAEPASEAAVWAQSEIEVERDGLEAALSRAGRRARIPSAAAVYREVYASLCRRAGRGEEAAKIYEQLQSSGAQPRIQRRQAFALAKSGREATAVPMLEGLLRSDPRDVYLLSGYEGACGRMGDLVRAVDFYHQLLTENPDAKHLFGRINRLKKKLAQEGSP